MVAAAYATREDLYRYGLPRGLLANPGRLTAAVYPDSDSIELDGHGFEDGTALLVRVEDGGAMPAPLVAGSLYYALRVSDMLFRLSETDGGSAINLTSAGSLLVVAASFEPTIDSELERYSRLLDSYLPAHQVPLTEPYPSVVVACVAKLAAASLLEITGQASDQVQASAEQTRRELTRLMRGVTLRDDRATAPANLAVAWGDGPRYDDSYSGVIP